MEQEDLQASGWDAIDQALAPLYAGQEPKHYGNLIAYELGGPNPLRGISAYKRLEPVPHWHFVTYGFTELYDKESTDLLVSGWGFELTLRLKTEPDAEEPPAWAINFLHNLARYVFGSGNVFANGDYLNANGPIAVESDTLLRSVAFIQDPELAPIDTPNGRVEFLQVVGITNDEELAIKQWKTLRVLEVFEEHLPLLVTDLSRASLLELQDVRERLSAGAASEGSSTGYLFVDQLAWAERKRLLRKPELQVTLGARQVREVLGVLPNRLPFDRELTLVGEETRVVFAPGDENRYTTEDTTLRLEIRPEVLDEVRSCLKPQEGSYGLSRFPGVVLQVRKTLIKDNDGQVVDTVG
ncbi:MULTISPECIES: suppressor of fused domain protein [unclassified Pseudomonas]|uniref:suppressor of fused domain protein n=1 Tax=unclassified Pseudomonas TaxID=196821 RepID=UPI00244A698E|nr:MULTISPECIES: suppressor of fused domain protein [unclassified Pseudomonas]MDG9930059.1 suppressor of fused domain protein [Pseudomonas sp. GD04042]MDH0483539.1 suppressor of fused domain protein [Pseudomonas sp. GD04015]MDH0605535.1 suppressor of fused domain protein [Pseudomonas sp. GD03869]